jgi:hypothetical protein
LPKVVREQPTYQSPSMVEDDGFRKENTIRKPNDRQ